MSQNKKRLKTGYHTIQTLHVIFQIPDVRLKCVLGLQGLYGDPLLLPKLDLFTNRFKVTPLLILASMESGH